MTAAYRRKLRLEYADWRRDRFRLIAGAAGVVDDPVDDPSKDDDPAAGGDNDDDDDDGDDDPAAGGSGGDDDELSQLRAQLADSQAKLNAAQAAARKAKDEAREARKKAAADGGNWEQLAKEREAELADVREDNVKLANERDEAVANLDKFQRNVRVTSIAVRLGYKDPQDALALISDEDAADDKSAERALRKLAESKDYLVDQRRRSGGPMGQGGGNGLFTMEQIKGMSHEQINANWEKVQASMAANGSGG